MRSSLTYGQDVILPLEINVKSLRVVRQYLLDANCYNEALLTKLDLVSKDRLMALENILVNKARVEKVYNRHVKPKSFLEGDLVWKSILPLGFHDS